MRLQNLLASPMMIDSRFIPTLLTDIAQEASNPSITEINEIGPAKGTEMWGMNVETGARFDGPASEQQAEDGTLLAVVPFTGVVTRHGLSTWYGYYPGTADIGRQLKALDQNKSIGAIVMVIDSPGGQVAGTPELAEIVYDIRKAGNTKIIAAVDTLMASAATYVGTACEKVYAMGTAMCGSIGVISSYSEYSKMLEQMGISVEVFREPSLKARFSGVEPMDDDMRETMIDRNSVIYDAFVDDVAKYRGVSASAVKKRFGGGEVMFAEEALEAGMIDGVATPDAVINMVFDDLAAANQEVSAKRTAKRKASMLAQLEAREGEVDITPTDDDE